MQQQYHVGNIEKLKPFVDFTIGWNLVAQKKRRFETNYYYIFSQKHVYRLMYSQYENPNILIWGKAKLPQNNPEEVKETLTKFYKILS